MSAFLLPLIYECLSFADNFDGEVCVCVVPLATYNAHPNDASLDISCDIHISPGSHECGESGRAIGRVQAFSFVAFKVQV